MKKNKKLIVKWAVPLIALLLLPIVLIAALAGRDYSNAVMDDFKAAHWDVKVLDLEKSEELAILRKLVSDERIADLPECDVIVASKAGIPLACVLAFPNKRAAKQYSKEYMKTLDEDRQNEYKAEKRIRGNCLLFYAGYGALDIYAGE